MGKLETSTSPEPAWFGRRRPAAQSWDANLAFRVERSTETVGRGEIRDWKWDSFFCISSISTFQRQKDVAERFVREQKSDLGGPAMYETSTASLVRNVTNEPNAAQVAGNA